AKLGHARGVVLLCLERASIPLHEHAPARVKLTLTGHGQAEKRQVGMMVRAVLGLEELPQRTPPTPWPWPSPSSASARAPQPSARPSRRGAGACPPTCRTRSTGRGPAAPPLAEPQPLTRRGTP